MSNSNRNISKLQHHKASTTTPSRSRYSALGRGGGNHDRITSDLERATLRTSSTGNAVAANVATCTPSTMNFEEADDDDLEMKLAATILEIQQDIPPTNQTQGTNAGNCTEVTPTENNAPVLHTTTIHQYPNQGVALITQPTDTNNNSTIMDTDGLPEAELFIQENQTNFSDPAQANTYEIPYARRTYAPLPKRKTYGRYTWRVHALPSESPFASLRTAIQEVWDALHESDPTLIIYPWYEVDGEDPDLALTRSGECPIVTNDLVKYFVNAYPRQKGGTYYIGVRMGHELSVVDLHRSSAQFFGSETNRTRVGYWYKSLQHEHTVQIGWLLGSTPYMSLERLTAEIFIRSGRKLEVGCRWQMIAVKKNVQVPEEQRFKAIHIEVKHEQHTAAMRFISSLFSKDRKHDFVFGTPMRLVPLLSKVTSAKNSTKCAHMREKQGVFLYQLHIVRVYNIGDVDFHSPRMQNKSLRDLIMDIRVDEPGSSWNLFRSCDSQPDGAVLLTFLSTNDALAFQIAQNLLAYLRFTNPPEYQDAITNGFGMPARIAAEDVTWDPVSRSIVTQADAVVNEIEDTELDDMLGYNPDLHNKVIVDLEHVDLVNASAPPPTGPFDDDSVSTFRSTKKTRFNEETTKPAAKDSDRRSVTRSRTATTSQGSSTTSQTPRPTLPNTTPRDDTSIQSEVTLESLLSRQTNLENVVHRNMGNIFDILQRLEQNQLASTQNEEKSSGTGRPP